jgi:uncharacterized protein YceK
MNRARRAIAPLIVLAMLAGCGTVSSGGSDGGSSAPRVRCQTDPTRDATSTSSPMVFLFCYESP